MDMVAKASDVSKQTVYSHFANKEVLYTAVIEEKCTEYALNQPCTKNDSLLQHLVDVGTQFIHLIFDEQVIAMYRVVIAESQNAPDVAALFFNAGPKPTMESVSNVIRGHCPMLSSASAMSLATDFLTLVKGEYHMRSMLGLENPTIEWMLSVHLPQCVENIMLLIEHRNVLQK